MVSQGPLSPEPSLNPVSIESCAAPPQPIRPDLSIPPNHRERCVTLLSSFARHTRNYSLASSLVMVAGLVSFPILTRLLPLTDYGVMSLVSSSLGFAVALGKLGMQHAALRFYSEVRAGKHPGVDLRQFAATVIYGMGMLGLVACALWLLAAWLLPASLWDDPRMPWLMTMTAVLVPLRVIDSAVGNLLRAQEQSGLLAIMGVLKRYVSLAVILGAVILIAPTVWSFFGATVVLEIVACSMTLWWVFRADWPRWRERSPVLFRAMVVFAVPMTGFELSSLVMQMGDRYVLQAMLGAEAVGLYSAAYNLSDYIKLALFTAMSSAALPMCVRLAESEGTAAVEAFLVTFTRTFLLIGLGVVAAMAAVGGDLMAVLASAKYQPAAVVIPWVMLGMMFEAYIVIAGVGLYLRKRSVVTMGMVAGGAVLNVVLNLLLVPRLGIQGSGVANLCSYAAVVAIALLATRRTLRPPPFALGFLKFGLMAVAAYLVANQVHAEWAVVSLVLRGSVAVLVYATLALLLDQRARQLLGQSWAKLKARRK
jgi:O-antigen/teichoic acid export membrane protein